MTPGAGVQSLDALKDWYAALSLFRTDAQNAQTGINLSLQRAADYLGRQQVYWKQQIRKAEEEVTQAKTELRNRQYKDKDGHHPDTTVQEENLTIALGRLHLAEDRLEATRRWMQRLPTVIHDVYDGPGRQLAFFLDIDLARALAELAKQLTALEQYLGLQAPQTPAAPPPSAKKDTP